MRRLGEVMFALASQYLETQETGDRIKKLEQENELLRNQLQDYPRLQIELEVLRNFQQTAAKEIADANRMLDQQRLLESQNLQERFVQLSKEKAQLAESLENSKRRIAEAEEAEKTIAQLKTTQEEKERSLKSEIARIEGSLKAREQEVTFQQAQIDDLQAQVGEKQVLEQQLATSAQQLKDAQATIVNLQAQLSRQTGGLEVDVDVESIVQQRTEDLRLQLELAYQEIKSLKQSQSENPDTFLEPFPSDALNEGKSEGKKSEEKKEPETVGV